MAGTRFQVKSYGADLVARHLRGLGRRADDLRPAWPAVAVQAAAGYKRSFRAQGPGWAPLKPSTVRGRIAEGLPAGPILRRTDTFYRSATDPTRLVLLEGPHSLEIAVDDEVAEYHRDGTSRMVARPLKLSFGDRMNIVKVIDRKLHEGYFSK